jgi:signal transduction histidine kinase
MRLLPQSLAGQLLLLLLGGVFCAHLLGVILFYTDSADPIRLAERNQITNHAASAVRVLEVAPTGAIPDMLGALSSPFEKFWIDQDDGGSRAAMSDKEARLARELERKLGGTDRQVTIKFGQQGQAPAPNRLGFSVAARLRDGSWLHYQRGGIEPLKWWRDLPFSIGMSMIPVLLVIGLSVGWITRPVRALAQAAEQVGRGERTDPLPVTGPREIRETTAAFNAMQDRLLRFVRDRTSILAAISHDFRTPITSLRLRAEMIEDEALKSAMTRTLDEMRDMVQATLGFASEGAAVEETRLVDLVGLLEAVADDQMTLGHEVEVNLPERLPYRCRPTSLKRAILNLTDNAIRYGERARVTLTKDASNIRILVDDDGPGIPPDKMEEVFEPFARLELSRNRKTGGVGLGLALARSCARSHGGDVVLSNNEKNGLRAEIILPA